MNELMTSEPLPSAGKPVGRAFPAVLCLLLVAATLGVYWPVTRCDFVNYDDPEYFAANPHVLTGLTPGNIVWALTTGHTGNWHPLTWLSLMLDVNLFGPGPAGPHVTNLLLHLANTALLFLLLRFLMSLCPEKSPAAAASSARATWWSALVAALFALHPMHVESVAWISERKDVLSTCFALLSLIAYARHVQSTTSDECRVTGTEPINAASFVSPFTLHVSRFYWLALLFFALGLMSKPMVVTLPWVLLLLDWWPLGRMASGGWRVKKTENPQLSTLLFEKWPFLLLSAISCGVTFLAQQKGGAVVALAKISIAGRIENAFVACARYLGKTFWPVALSNPYPYPGHWAAGFVAFSVVLVVGLTVAAVGLRRKLPWLPMGWFWFAGTLVPVIGLVQVGSQSMADRYMYLPQIGIFMMVACALAGIVANRRWFRPVAGILAAVVLIACGMRTRDQIGHWQNSGTLFSHALAMTENNYVACNNLGTWHSKNGQVAQAIDCFRRSLEIKADNPDALYNLGNASASQGDWDTAITDYRRALQMTADQADILNNLGFALAMKRQLPDAIACFEAALKLNPDSASTHNNLAAVLFQEQRLEEAVVHYREALRITPDDPRIYLNLGDTLMKLKKPAEAVLCYKAALRFSPDDPQIKAKLQALRVQF
jgi:Tfp pilus assembly protein PilF